MRTEFSDLVSGLRTELASERTMRAEEYVQIDARLSALESKGTRAGSSGGDERPVCVVGGFGLLPKVDALAKVNTALVGVDGFIEAYGTGDAPKVAFARFACFSSMLSFVRG